LCLTERGLSDAIKEYIEKDEKDAISELVNFQIEKTQKYLKSTNNNSLNENQIDDEIKKFRRLRIAAEQEEVGEIKEIFNKVSQKSIKSKQYNDDDGCCSDDDVEDKPSSLIKIKGKSKTKSYADDEDDDEINIKLPEVKAEKEEFDQDLSVSKRGAKRGGRGSRGGRGGRGRGATASTQKTTGKNQTQLEMTNFIVPKKEALTQISSTFKPSSKAAAATKSDSDSDIEILKAPSRSNITIKQEPLASRASNITLSASQKPSQQSNMTRKIQYEDDSDDDKQSQQVTFEVNRNKTKKNENVADDDDDDDDDFNIFKRVNNPKRRKV
jgi:double-strand break repair protein MRE11